MDNSRAHTQTQTHTKFKNPKSKDTCSISKSWKSIKKPKYSIPIKTSILSRKLDKYVFDQLRRASFSIVLNIAEGSGRFTKPDKRRFFIIARSSLFETIAILDILKDDGIVEDLDFEDLYLNADEISRMLLGLIRSNEV